MGMREREFSTCFRMFNAHIARVNLRHVENTSHETSTISWKHISWVHMKKKSFNVKLNVDREYAHILDVQSLSDRSIALDLSDSHNSIVKGYVASFSLHCSTSHQNQKRRKKNCMESIKCVASIAKSPRVCNFLASALFRCTMPLCILHIALTHKNMLRFFFFRSLSTVRF